jgi:glycerol uptake facilitator-like aquaporin
MPAGFQSIRNYAYSAELRSSILTGAAGALLANTAATVAALAVVIVLFGPVSGAHFNPAVTVIQALRQRLRFEADAYIAVQVVACCAGAVPPRGRRQLFLWAPESFNCR